MLNEAIVGQLFSMFKEEYGYAIDDAAGLFDGQRDMLEFLMKLCRFARRSGGSWGDFLRLGRTERKDSQIELTEE